MFFNKNYLNYDHVKKYVKNLGTISVDRALVFLLLLVISISIILFCLPYFLIQD